MAKITIARLFEVGQYLTTEAGKELSDALRYLSEFVEVTVRALRNGLTLDDNFAATIKRVSIVSGREEIIVAANTEQRRVRSIMVRQVIDDANYVVTSFGWKYDALGNVVIKCTLENDPTVATPIEIAILF